LKRFNYWPKLYLGLFINSNVLYVYWCLAGGDGLLDGLCMEALQQVNSAF